MPGRSPLILRVAAAVAALALCAAAAAIAPWSSGTGSRSPEAAAAVPACTGTRAVDLACQMRRYAAVVRASGVRVAFAALKRAYARHGFVRAACHPIVHAIGHAAVERHGRDLGRVYARGDPFCSAGYYHGATEQLIADQGRQDLVANADAFCARLGGHARHSIYHRNCAHGIGHGFMLALRGDLPRALTTCDALADAWERRSCYGGVFMQNVMALTRSRYLRPTEPLYPCPALRGRYRAMCYRKQAGYALYLRDSDAGAVFGMCAQAGRPWRRACAEGVGTSVAVHHLKEIARREDQRRLVAAACTLGPRRVDRAGCVAGAVRALINFDHDTRRAAGLCRAVAASLARGCRRTIAAKRVYPE